MTTNTIAPNRVIRNYRIINILDHTPAIREVVFKSKTELDLNFKAGQFVMLHVPQGENKPVLRAYSIANSDKEKQELRLIFKFVENGKASNFVWELKKDDEVNFTGPFGKVIFKEPATEQIVFLNTGTGVTQHLSFIYSAFDSAQIKKAHLFFGVRTESDIYLQKELDELKDKFTFFNYNFVLSRPSPTWKGLSGYVQDHIKNLDFQKTPTTFYLCGNGSMIKATKKFLIEDHNFESDKVIAEAFD